MRIRNSEAYCGDRLVRFVIFLKNPKIAHCMHHFHVSDLPPSCPFYAFSSSCLLLANFEKIFSDTSSFEIAAIIFYLPILPLHFCCCSRVLIFIMLKLFVLTVLVASTVSASPSRKLTVVSSTMYPDGQKCEWGTDMLLAIRLAANRFGFELDIHEASGIVSDGLISNVSKSVHSSIALLGLAWSNVAQIIMDNNTSSWCTA